MSVDCVVVVSREVMQECSTAAQVERALAWQKALLEVSRLGIRSNTPLPALERASSLLAEVLGCEFASVLELQPGTNGFRILTGHGRPARHLGAALSAGPESQAGRALALYERSEAKPLAAPRALVYENIREQPFYATSPLLHELSVESGITVVIPGTLRPYGVLSAFSRASRRFHPEEVEFVQACANVLAETIERCRVQAALRENEDLYRDLVEHCEDLMCTHDLEGRLVSVNPWAAKCLGYEREAMLNVDMREFLHPKVRREFDAYLARIRADGVANGLLLVRTRNGETRVWEYRNTLRVNGVSAPLVRGMAHDISDRLCAEKALRESEECFRTLTELSSDYYWEQDAEYRFVRRVGMPGESQPYPPEDVLGKTRWELPALNLGAAEWAKHRAELDARREFHDLEIERPLPSGETRWISTSGRPMFDASGKFCGYRGMGKVITLRKRAERALAESEERYRNLIETSHDLIWAVDRDRRITFVNDACRRIYGREPQEMIGRPFFEFVPAELHQKEMAFFAEVMRTGADVLDHEITVCHKDGTTVVLSVNARAVRDKDGKVVGTTGSSRDVTAAKKSEQAQREQRLLLARAQRLAGLGYWEYEASSGLMRGSRELRRMFDVRIELPGQTPEWSLGVVDAQDRERVRGALQRAIEHGASFELEAGVTTIGGRERIMLIAGEGVKDKAGYVSKVIGSCLDITERRRRESALCDAADELQALSRRLVEAQETERRRLAAELHDQVGQNLTALSINLDILASRMNGLDADARRRLQDSLALLESTGQRVEGVLNDLRPPMLDDWGVGPTVQWVAEDFTGRTEIPAPVRILGTERRIDRQSELALVRIVQEALNNVAKHAHAGMVEIMLGWESDSVRVELADNGIGFESNGSGGRRGLGLLSMRERMQAAHGMLDIESEPGKGTRVRARVPG